MRITLRRSASPQIGDVVVRLDQADDFTAFGVDIEPGLSIEDVDLALHAADAGTVTEDHAHAWISLMWLRPQCIGALPGRRPQFEAMIAFARQHGWVSEDGQSLRGHFIQLAAPSSSRQETP